ncbi:hypothetical protein J2T56_003072 [Natronobacillus azotifigens]|uniref:Uncharacterized protein n=1 Tax=Natronobacillus azotifigens TaxID=472978 RepID=A0A9J6RAT5_9BACI|nr:hypothetical protein [Natronobacillus azotifigens]MCZ0702786.1 hypothetical protein [Natronobacillus azotifigens]
MLNRVLTMELGNDKGLRSTRNLLKLFYTFILPNITAIQFAYVIHSIPFIDHKLMLIFVLYLNLLVITIIQYSAQKKIFSSLEKEVLLKFIPNKTKLFIKYRLFFLIIKFNLPMLLFSSFYFETFIRAHTLLFTVFALFSILVIMIFQMYLAIIIRYWTNTMRAVYLQGLQILIFLLFVVLLSGVSFTPVLFLAMLDRYWGETISTLFYINALPIIITVALLAFISISLIILAKQINMRVLVLNRNLSFNLNTATLEKIQAKVYGLDLSRLQKLLFVKDIKYVFRNSKVQITLMGVYHLILLFSIIFFFLDISENEMGIFMAKFYLALTIGQLILSYILGVSFNDVLDFKNDLSVVGNYHIKLSETNLIREKIKILRAFVFPKLTITHIIFILTLLLLNQYMLALVYLLNYLICFWGRKALELFRVKTANQLNSERGFLEFVNFIIIMVIAFLLMQLLNSSDDNIYFFQLLSLGSVLILYFYHLFVFKKKKEVNVHVGS